MGPHPTNHFRNLLILLTPVPGSSPSLSTT
jgi:hypothetical protein